MHIYVDTADVDRIRDCDALGVVDGVTTNPSLVVESGMDYREAVATIGDAIDGPVFAQVIADDPDDIVREARAYAEWTDELIVKIPADRAGFEALGRVRDAGVPAGITTVFSVAQAVLAAKNDASFVAPYVGRLDDAGEDGVDTVRTIQSVYDAYGFETELLAANVRTVQQAVELYEAGVDAVTLPADLLTAHVPHPKTEEGIAGFRADWGDRGSPLADSG
jgi:transaldolase